MLDSGLLLRRPLAFVCVISEVDLQVAQDEARHAVPPGGEEERDRQQHPADIKGGHTWAQPAVLLQAHLVHGEHGRFASRLMLK